MDACPNVEQLVEAQLDRARRQAKAGGASNRFGISDAVARSHGYSGPVARLPRAEAARIYTRQFWLRPRLDAVAMRTPRVAALMFEAGANLGPAVAATFLQRVLNALNHDAVDYPDLVPDGRIGERTLQALDTFLERHGRGSGEGALHCALEAMHGERYLRLAERRPSNHGPLYHWLADRTGVGSDR
jgi:lysozyme family protein